MNDDELDSLLNGMEAGDNIDWNGVGETKAKQKNKDPTILQDELDNTDYLKNIESVVYKIDDGTNCYVGRTCFLYDRLVAHAWDRTSKAHPIIQGYKGRRADLVSILWKGPWTESEDHEARYIAEFSTMQKPTQAAMSPRPLESTKTVRKNTIPKDWYK